jgi:hypothetical protein
MASLLPAPEQAILNANLEKSFAALYRPSEPESEKVETTPKKASAVKKVAESEADHGGDEEEVESENDYDDDDDVDDDTDEE